MSTRIRFGVMVTGEEIESWQARCLLRLLATEGVEAALIIRRADEQLPAAGILARLRPFDALLWRLYVRFYVVRRSHMMQPLRLGDVLGDCPEIVCRPVPKGKFGVGLAEGDLARIQDANLDFILLLDFGILKGDILRAARYGVWSFHHDDPQRHRGLPPAFWEIYDGDLVSGAILQRLTERLDGGIILQRGWVKTVDYSYVRNIDAVYASGIAWPARVCADIQNGVAGYLDDRPTRTTAPVRYLPSTSETLRFWLTLARGTIRRARRILSHNEQWSIGVIDAPIQSLLNEGVHPPARWLPEPGRARFLADPFAVRRGAALTILAEEYDYRDGRGIISAVEVPDKGRATAARAVLRQNIHLSYPYLIEHEGALYCIPETAEAREIALYRAAPFPDAWEKVATLVPDFAGADATVFQCGERWWMFCTDADADVDATLCAFWADDLAGPWRPHTGNPLKVDVRSARPAGTPFVRDGRLYRPAQDCSRVYAGAVVVQHVSRLTPNEFVEETVTRVEPYARSRYPDGLHTLCAAGEQTVIDAKREIFMLPALLARVRRLLARN